MATVSRSLTAIAVMALWLWLSLSVSGCASSPPEPSPAGNSAAAANAENERKRSPRQAVVATDAHAHRHDDHHHDHAHPHGESHGHVHADDAEGHAHAEHMHPEHDPQAPCICSLKQTGNIWCRQCNVGYLAMRRIDSAMLFDALDPHGHVIDLGQLTCATCRSAVDSDGYCDDCGMGFVDGQAYFTQLTHGLAQGRALPPGDIDCPMCRRHVRSAGWCDQCDRGMVGNVAITERALFRRTADQWMVLEEAQAKVETCELCACAMVVHRTCPECWISYEEDGRPSPKRP